MKHTQRGQTLVELVIAMPIVLLALFAIMYIARLGVLNERAELAVRYGGIMLYNAGGTQYSAANIYANLAGSLPACPTPPVSILSDASPFPGPTSAPYWQPDASPAPTSSCTTGASGFGGSQFIASHFWNQNTINVTASIAVPPFLTGAIGSSAGTASTTLTFTHAANPGIILWCSTEVRNRVNDAITAQGSATLPTPIPDGSSPPPNPPNNNGSCN
ncbi:MAG TPA: TadE/TadG family type IV pilus assembly protein [Candidatus Rubrimentiphilum sp.]|nr:TadE/TadG family type IV pilus assembly protein [Candidatus Rubrimentiphilum sp.]